MRRFLYLTVFFSGMTTLAAEFGASRLLQTIYGSSNLVWASVIGLILVYFAAGYQLGGRWADRSPHAQTLFTILALGAFALGVVPFIAQPVLRGAALAFDSLQLDAAFGAFAATLILFSLPITLLAVTSPFVIRLLVDDPNRAGNVAGDVYALSTLGSVIGAFLPTLVLFPLIGVTLSFLLFSSLMLLIAFIGLWRASGIKAVLPFLLMPLFLTVLAVLNDYRIKSTPGQIYETESAYNYIEVLEVNGTRYLRLNEGQGVHSQYHPTELFYGGPWEQFSVGPLFNNPPFSLKQVERIAIIGLAAGTAARQATAIYGPIPIDGWEIDPKIIEVGREYFGMTLPNLNAYAADGRWGLEHSLYLYDIIIVDAYRPPYIPPHLTTQEFFAICAERLTQDGVLAINIGRAPNDRRLINDLAATIRTVLPSTHVMDLPYTFNSVLFATKQPTSPDNLAFNLAALHRDPSTPALLLSAAAVTYTALQPAPSGGIVYTDDRSPIEWVTNSLVLNFILTGGVDELK
ncbi:MAG: spermine synthase [Anaerolineae bacterium]|nr:MAG: spermine synthase [Anaerolineae bacterium]